MGFLHASEVRTTLSAPVLPPNCEQLLRVRNVTDKLSMPLCSLGSMMSLASSIA